MPLRVVVDVEVRARLPEVTVVVLRLDVVMMGMELLVRSPPVKVREVLAVSVSYGQSQVIVLVTVVVISW